MDMKTTKIICYFMVGIVAVLVIAMMITKCAIFGYAAIAGMAFYAGFHHLFWRCPACEKNIGPLWVKHCPNCGEKID